MARWPEIVRDKPFVSMFTAVLVAMFVVWVAALRGMWVLAVAGSVAALVLTCVALFAWSRRRRESHRRAAANTFSFADVVARLHAKDRAEALIEAQRRKELIALSVGRVRPHEPSAAPI